MGTITKQIESEKAAAITRLQQERDLRAEQLARRAELNRQYRAEAKRKAAAFDFDQFCKAQRARIAKTLQQSADRVNTARWGRPDGDGFYAVTRSGTTEVSRPVKREYQEQEV
jgi:hypothetical protein